MNNSKWKKLSYFFLLFIGAFYLYFYHSRLAVLKSIAVVDLVIIAALSFGTFFFLAIQFKLLVEIFYLNLRFKEWFGLTVINTMISYYTPARGGLIARAYYLNRKYDLSYSKYISLVGGSYAINFMVASLGIIFFSAFSALLRGAWNLKILGVGTVLLMATMALCALLLTCSSRIVFIKTGRIYNVLNNFMEGLNLFIKHPFMVLKISFIQFFLIIIMGAKLYWSFKATGRAVEFTDILVVQSFVVFSMIVSITPGNLGIKEGIIGLLASHLGVPFADAILAASIDRGISMLITFLLGMSYSKILIENEFI